MQDVTMKKMAAESTVQLNRRSIVLKVSSEKSHEFLGITILETCNARHRIMQS